MKKVLCLFCVLIFLCQAHAGQANFFFVKLNKVIDGDTFDAFYNNFPLRVRLYGVDSPEKNQQGFQEAKEELEKLIPFEQSFVIEVLYFDRYHRAVALVHTEGGETVQAKLLESGNAWLDLNYCKLSLCNYWKEIESIARKK